MTKDVLKIETNKCLRTELRNESYLRTLVTTEASPQLAVGHQLQVNVVLEGPRLLPQALPPSRLPRYSCNISKFKIFFSWNARTHGSDKSLYVHPARETVETGTVDGPLTGADNVDSRCGRQVVMCTMYIKKKKLISYYLCLFQNKLIITHRRELFFKRVKIRQVTFHIILSIVKNLNVSIGQFSLKKPCLQNQKNDPSTSPPPEKTLESNIIFKI